jgi:4,5-dihydroxyphthalate decarboxylase
MMPRLKITLGCCDYEHTRALAEGRIQPDGVDLNFVKIQHGGAEVNFRMLRHQEFEASEMSMGSYVVSLFANESPFIAIPVFPFRTFRHSFIFVNVHSGIEKPTDLISKRVGNPRYQQTACVWMRGILSDHYGVPVSSVTYYQGGEEEPGRWEGLPIELPPGINVRPAEKGKKLSEMLEKGEIDALYASRIPSSFSRSSKNIRRLFPDFQNEERKYFKETNIFPIMHTIVIRRDVYEANRWLAQSLYKSFLASKEIAYEDYYKIKGLPGAKFMLPWIAQYMEQIRDLMGDDFFPYGIEPNLPSLQTFLRYCHEQGLAKRLLKPEDIFAPETVAQFKV